MGSLGPSESFGEVSLISQKPMSCTVVTATEVKLASIEPAKLKGNIVSCSSACNTGTVVPAI